MGGFKFSVYASIYNVPCPIPCTFEEDRTLHTWVTSQGNFFLPLATSQYSYLAATCYLVRHCLQGVAADNPPITCVARVIAIFN